MKRTSLLAKFHVTLYSAFVNDCIDAIYIGYGRMRQEGIYKVDWVEDKLTALLIRKIEESNYLTERSIHICPQFPLYDDDIVYGNGNPANAPVIDFKFGQLWREKEVSFFAEAKNLSAKSWKKPNGPRVSASYYNKRYIETGVCHYLSGYYPKGCLLGYIVNGDVPSVVEGINKIITAKKYKIENKSIEELGVIIIDPGAKWKICHQSANKVLGEKYTLQHLMLQLA